MSGLLFIRNKLEIKEILQKNPSARNINELAVLVLFSHPKLSKYVSWPENEIETTISQFLLNHLFPQSAELIRDLMNHNINNMGLVEMARHPGELIHRYLNKEPLEKLWEVFNVKVANSYPSQIILQLCHREEYIRKIDLDTVNLKNSALLFENYLSKDRKLSINLTEDLAYYWEKDFIIGSERTESKTFVYYYVRDGPIDNMKENDQRPQYNRFWRLSQIMKKIKNLSFENAGCAPPDLFPKVVTRENMGLCICLGNAQKYVQMFGSFANSVLQAQFFRFGEFICQDDDRIVHYIFKYRQFPFISIFGNTLSIPSELIEVFPDLKQYAGCLVNSTHDWLTYLGRPNKLLDLFHENNIELRFVPNTEDIRRRYLRCNGNHNEGKFYHIFPFIVALEIDYIFHD